MVCGSVTDIYLLIYDSHAHMSMTLMIKLHTFSGICEYNCAKALIIIISFLHSFLRFHKGDHVLIESRNDTHSRLCLQLMFLMLHVIVALLLNLYSFCKDFIITILGHTLQFHLFISLFLCIC